MKSNSILLNLILMLFVALALGLGVAWGLSGYTRHGEVVIIPELRGKSLAEVERLLQQADLNYELIDSIYDEGATPGVVKELTPAVGSKVKPGRILFLTIYARAPRALLLPYVENMSSRQALTLLRGLGFESITTKLVSGEYRDLCLGVTTEAGEPIQAGSKLSKRTPLVLLISGAVLDSLNTNDLIDTLGGAQWNPDEMHSAPAQQPAEAPRVDTTTVAPVASEPEEWW